MTAYNGNWIDLNGHEVDSLLTHYTLSSQVTKGESYQFRYRVKNAIGWSDFSDEMTIVAADVPGQLDAPIFDSATDTSITLNLNTITDNGGSPILSYTLQIKDETNAGSFGAVATYSSGDSTHTLTLSDDSLVAGNKYSFRWFASNEAGDSPVSQEV